MINDDIVLLLQFVSRPPLTAPKPPATDVMIHPDMIKKEDGEAEEDTKKGDMTKKEEGEDMSQTGTKLKQPIFDQGDKGHLSVQPSGKVVTTDMIQLPSHTRSHSQKYASSCDQLTMEQQGRGSQTSCGSIIVQGANEAYGVSTKPVLLQPRPSRDFGEAPESAALDLSSSSSTPTKRSWAMGPGNSPGPQDNAKMPKTH